MKTMGGLWSSLVGYQPRALGIVGSNPANPIQISQNSNNNIILDRLKKRINVDYVTFASALKIKLIALMSRKHVGTRL